MTGTVAAVHDKHLFHRDECGVEMSGADAQKTLQSGGDIAHTEPEGQVVVQLEAT